MEDRAKTGGGSEGLFPDPKMAINIAELFGNLSTLEVSIYQAMASLLGDDDGRLTEAILSRVDSISYKLDVVFDIARIRDAAPVSPILLAAEPDIRAAVAMRNKLAHGLYVQKADGSFGVVSNAFRVGRRKVDGEPLDRQVILHHCNRIIEIMTALAAVSDPNGITLHGGVVTVRPRLDHG